MRRRIFEDFIINKLNGYYLILSGYDYYYSSKLVFTFTELLVKFLVLTRIIPPRRQP